MSNAAIWHKRYTVEEFEELELDAPDGERWELIDGHIVRMMTGGTIAHNRIVRNFAGAVERALRSKGSPCEVFTENVKFATDALDTATYPDVIVTCEPVKNEATKIEAPVVLVEVLSKTSIARDRIEKWGQYARATSLQHYMLIEQLEPLIEIYSRQPTGDGETWSWTRITDLSAAVTFADLSVSVALADIYARVFDAA